MGTLWDDALGNHESLNSSELFKPAEVAQSSLSEAGIPFLFGKVFFFAAQYVPHLEYTLPSYRLADP